VLDHRLLDELTSIVSRAAAAILDACADALAPRTKSDQSPVTAADEASEAAILDGLARALPDVPVVSEEACERSPARSPQGRFILVDPLDGTRELIAGRDEFCINLAIVEGGQAHCGIIAAPALGLVWRTAASGGTERMRLLPGAPVSAASERTAIRARRWPEAGAVATISRSHLDARTKAFLSGLPPAEQVASGSAIKLCRIAEGAADVYPRLAPVRAWDVAAGAALVAAAGGIITAADGSPLCYDRADFLVPDFVAWGDPAAAARLAGPRAATGPA